MDIFAVLTLLGGLALFLYGMNIMGGGLEKMAGGKLETIFEKLTSNPLKAMLLGAGVTAVIQSSSATTVMLVGFVNAGLMKLHQAIGVIMGANIGTTITAWILSLSGLDGESFFIRMLKPTSFSPILAVIGIAFIMIAKSDKKKTLGTIFLGFAILMYGMNMMSGAVEPLKDSPSFTNMLTWFSNPVFGRARRSAAHGYNTVLLRFGRNTSGAFIYRRYQVRHCFAHNIGSEYRHLRYRDNQLSRHKQKRQARSRRAPQLQRYRHGDIPHDILYTQRYL